MTPRPRWVLDVSALGVGDAGSVSSWIAFERDRVSGTTGCNDFHGPYTLQGKKLGIGPLTATEKACPTTEASEQEAGYLSALESAVRIEQAGPQLTLLNAKGQKAVTLTRK